VAAVVLAAGAASRFGGGKLLAALEGRPVLQHVLDALSDCGLCETVVVVGDDAAAIEAAMAGPGVRLVRNERPADGLASSLWTGIAALGDEPQAALVVLGDQPRLRPGVVSTLVAAAEAADVAVVPRYADGGDPNPVLLLRTGWPLISRTLGDRGLGPIFAARPGLVRHVPVPGSNPDVDTLEDLARLERAADDERHAGRPGTLR
jgi:molybdenum cofactor cytidylyltransferase